MTQQTVLDEVVECARQHLRESCTERVGPDERRAAAEAALGQKKQRGRWARALLSDARCHQRYTEAMKRASPRTLPQFVLELVIIILEADDGAGHRSSTAIAAAKQGRHSD